jgi:hypothetical protein
MAHIHVDAGDVRRVQKLHYAWWQAQPKGQFGRATQTEIVGNVNPLDNTVLMILPDAFVDELEGSGIAFKRMSTV